MSWTDDCQRYDMGLDNKYPSAIEQPVKNRCWTLGKHANSLPTSDEVVGLVERKDPSAVRKSAIWSDNVCNLVFGEPGSIEYLRGILSTCTFVSIASNKRSTGSNKKGFRQSPDSRKFGLRMSWSRRRLMNKPVLSWRKTFFSARYRSLLSSDIYIVFQHLFVQ